MKNLHEAMQEEYERMRSIREAEEKNLSDLAEIEGTLRISKRKNETLYYHRVTGDRSNGTYLSKKQSEFVHQLAQKTYDKKVMKLAAKRELQWKIILKDYRDDEIERLYTLNKPERCALITPIEPTWEQQLDNWLKMPYQGKPFSEDAPYILTNSGQRVRSKSEKIMADFFDHKGIPYKYECPLYLKSFGYVYPDFTFLSQKTRKEIYWEHDGMMDQPEYAKNAVKKIDLYQRNGILQGERLIVTFETSSTILNTNILEQLTELWGLA